MMTRVTAYVGIAQRMTYIRVWHVWRLYAVPYVLTYKHGLGTPSILT